MTSRSVIPPSRTKTKPGGNTLQVLQKRLQSAETETISLVRQLSNMGFQQQQHPSQGRRHHPQPGRSHQGAGERIPAKDAMNGEPVLPFIPQSADSGMLRKNYESLVSRVCSTESQLQTLKLNLCTLQAEKDLNGTEAGKLKETFDQVKETHEIEVKKLNHEIVLARKEWKDVLEARNTAEEEVRRLKSALELATKTKSELAIEFEEMKSTKGKHNRHITEVREELAREVSLRTSLEESHTTLLNRIQEMESVVLAERKQVQMLAHGCSELHREGVQIQEEKKQLDVYQKQLEETIRRLKLEAGDKEVKLSEVFEENKVLGAAVSGLKREIVNLNQQCQQLQDEHDKLQKIHSSSQKSKESESVQRAFSDELSKLQAANEMAEEKRNQLEAELADVKSQYNGQVNDYQEQIELLERTVSQLKSELSLLQGERENVIKAKENLLDEVNQAVDVMSDERTRLQEQLIQAQHEVTAIADEKQQLQQENNRLMERLTAAEQHHVAQEKVESSLAEMLESKNRLAYEKGQLQSQVSELQQHLAVLGSTQAELRQTKSSHAALQEKYNKTTGNLSQVKMGAKRLEGQLKQEQSNCQMKEQDFQLAIKARDEALKESQRLKNQLARAEKKEKQQVVSLQQSLSDAKQDQGKMASTLDGVMDSHQQLQQAVERLQTELGRKDSALKSLQQERSSSQYNTAHLQREVEQLQTKLVSIETSESEQIQLLQVEMSSLKEDKKQLSLTVEELIQTNGQLQTAVEKQRHDLDTKEHQLLQESRSQKAAEEIQEQYEERLSKLRQQLLNKKQAGNKRLQHELQEVKDQNELLSSRLAEVTQNNSDLNSKLSKSEETISKQTNRIQSQKVQLEHYHQMKKTNKESSSKVAAIQQRLEEMEKANKDYVAKNKEQAKTIASFVTQMRRMEKELQAVSKAQQDMSNNSKKRSVEVYKERGKPQESLMEKTARLESQVYKERGKPQESLTEKTARLESQVYKERGKPQESLSEKTARLESQVYKERGKPQESLTEKTARLESQVYKERGKPQESLMEKTARLESEVSTLKKERDKAEEKLLEISNESVQISSSLEEAHNWFRDRYNALQQELAVSKERQNHLEAVNTQQQHQLDAEKSKAEQQTLKAKSMIRSSREALSRVADQAEIHHLETKTHMRSMTYRLQAEKDHSNLTDKRIHRLLNSSAQYIEDLSEELDQSRMQQT